MDYLKILINGFADMFRSFFTVKRKRDLTPKERREALIKSLNDGTYRVPRMSWRDFYGSSRYFASLNKEQRKTYREYLYRHGITKDNPED